MLAGYPSCLPGSDYSVYSTAGIFGVANPVLSSGTWSPNHRAGFHAAPAGRQPSSEAVPASLAVARMGNSTLNTSAESGCLFNVLSVEVFNLRCISTFLSRRSLLFTNVGLYFIP